ncbi:MAG: hypothetical protein GX235_10870 [Clostridiales bacterium]|nr:hypothetical protein [Clostridiales bacterium]
MKTVKRIIYTLIGLVLACTILLVCIILFAEYSGKRFTSDSLQVADGIEDDESRLVYDENGNVVEFPDGTSDSASGTVQEAPDAAGNVQVPAEESVQASDTDATAPSPEIQESQEDADISADDNIERTYVMDMGTNIFHTADCPYVQDIKEDDRSERSTSRAKILNAGYQPCTNCNP